MSVIIPRSFQKFFELGMDAFGKGNPLPVEEKSLRDFYPDLSTTRDLFISKNLSDDLIHQFFIQDPLPAIKVEFTKQVMKPVFKILDISRPKFDEIPPFKHFIEATEDELQERVEYDMDEQDKEWLNEFNVRQRKLSYEQLSMDYFEFLMDQLEKEWFDLIKDVPKSSVLSSQYPEDITCAVCDDGNSIIHIFPTRF